MASVAPAAPDPPLPPGGDPPRPPNIADRTIPSRKYTHYKQTKPETEFGQSQMARRFGNAVRTMSGAHKRTSSNVQSPEQQQLGRQHHEEPQSPTRQSSLLLRARDTTSQFFRRGIRSQDSPAQAVAHQQQTMIRREHRAQRRAGEQPSPTPPTQELLPRPTQELRPRPTATHLSGGAGALGGDDEDDDYFICDECGIARLQAHRLPDGLCIYCGTSGDGFDQDDEMQVCLRCHRSYHRHAFLTTVGDERPHCQRCSQVSMTSTPSSSQSQFTHSQSSDMSPSPLISRRTRPSRPLPLPLEEQSGDDPAVLLARNPSFHDDLSEVALNQADRALLAQWQQELDSNVMEYCPRCHKKWFDMEMRNGICSSCYRHDNGQPPEVPNFFSADNALELGDVLAHLPTLTQVEEMLIARVYVHVQVFQYRGQQYKYRGHVINFLRDVGSVYTQLPLLPRDLDILILRPRNAAQQPHVVRQFQKQFQVQQNHIRVWLQYLRVHHPGYRDIVVDEEVLSQLPADGDISDQLMTQAADEAIIEDVEVLQDDEPVPIPGDYDGAAVPNFLAAQADLEQLRDQLNLQERPTGGQVPVTHAETGQQPYLRMPGIRSTPISEFNRSQALLSLAFPTLYPNGQADFAMPRQRSITYSEYIEHALKHYDGRFARHPRFRYTCFNTLMRSQVQSRSSFFVKKPGQAQSPVDLTAIRTAFDEDTPEAKRLLNSIVKYSDSLLGTRAFWGADHRTKTSISGVNLRDSPHIAAYHFHQRFRSFLKLVLKPKFNVTDFWYRYEWQARGSTHAHGNHATAFNPGPMRMMQQGEGDPLITMQPLPTFGTVSEVINRVQRHRCTEAYCLRRRRLPDGTLSETAVCRFNFPRELHDEAYVTTRLNPQYLIFNSARNDTSLNNYNRTLSVGWLANHDISPCTSVHAVVNYIAKYCSKAEHQTQSYRDIAREVLPHVNHERGITGFVAKFMNKLAAERDWSAMEVNHLLLNLPLQKGSRTVRSVDCRTPDRHFHADAINEGGEDLTYFEFATKVDFQRSPWRYFPNAPDRVLNYFPRYKADREHEQYPDFCRVKLMLHPHRHHDELMVVEGEAFTSFPEAYDYCQSIHPGAHPHDYYGNLPPPVVDDFEEDPAQEDQITEEDWVALAGELPRLELDTEDVELLGNRDIDLAYSWASCIDKYPNFLRVGSDYWKQRHEQVATSQQAAPTTSQSIIDQLNPEQQLVFDLFERHLLDTLDPNITNPEQLLLQVNGEGGTGKSFMINAICGRLNDIDPRGVTARAAPTRVAANAINGVTIHSLLRLPVSKTIQGLPPISASDMSNLQAKLRSVRYLVIDEKSMIGLRMLGLIDARLRQVFPQGQNKFFGGLNVLLLGDFYQLPPVMEKPLYSNANLTTTSELAGRNAYHAFKKTVILKQVVRQAGDDQADFRNALQSLRNNTSTQPHWQLLCTRFQALLPITEVAAFDDAPRIYYTNAQVKEYNRVHMEKLQSPCVQIKVTNLGAGAADADSSMAGNLHNKLPLCIGAQVMLTENIWTDVGLVNGAIGEVYDLAWNPSVTDPHNQHPSVVLVRFDRYSGPPCFDDPALAKVVPIYRSSRDFIKGSAVCTRTQFPITIAYSMTVHKMQGTTLDRAVADISLRDFQSGLTYVTVSRVKTLQGIMFDSAFDLSDLRARSRAIYDARGIDIARRATGVLYAS
ncbi:hypothetical protein AK830_g6688 [Neonectria ditissima]|uniref:ATP-dependent DNA helicase n=1 Tax=Neonectria ditissima TaxID=78410 RepID=A0A0P7BHC8_9HYPO|nr:hypothetical protein AK830_g6688 [Neonectria ditissima]